MIVATLLALREDFDLWSVENVSNSCKIAQSNLITQKMYRFDSEAKTRQDVLFGVCKTWRPVNTVDTIDKGYLQDQKLKLLN